MGDAIKELLDGQSRVANQGTEETPIKLAVIRDGEVHCDALV
jgi:hypothetical protein